MIFHEIGLPGANLIEPERNADHRGFFARLWCERELTERGLAAEIKQTSIAVNTHRGTLRGMHFQRAPHAEVKIVRCPRGAVYDVIVDLRPQSPTFKRWYGVELDAKNALALYIPEGFAHGYMTLRDDSETHYQMSTFHAPDSASGVRYDDPAFGIEWPLPVAVISERDASWADFSG